MSREIIELENLRVRKNASSGACLALHSNGCCSRPGARLFPGFQMPVNQRKSFLVLLLRSNHVVCPDACQWLQSPGKALAEPSQCWAAGASDAARRLVDLRQSLG